MHSNHSYKGWAANSKPFLYKKEDEKKQQGSSDSNLKKSSENDSPIVIPELGSSTGSTDKKNASETSGHPDKEL